MNFIFFDVLSVLDLPLAERIYMGHRALDNEAALCLKSFHDFLALEIRHLLRESSDIDNRAR